MNSDDGDNESASAPGDVDPRCQPLTRHLQKNFELSREAAPFVDDKARLSKAFGDLARSRAGALLADALREYERSLVRCTLEIFF